MPDPSDTLAAELLEVVPLVFRTIRAEMRQRRGADLSIPQFRALIHLNRQPRASLTELADYLGLTDPTTCRLVDDLVARTLVTRVPSSADRRKVELDLTPEGRHLLSAAYRGTLEQLTAQLSPLSSVERAVIVDAMALLRRVFSRQAG